MLWVVDTNLLLIARGRHEDISPGCVKICILRLTEIQKKECVALDDGYRILSEYLHKTNPKGGKDPGQVFLKWLLRNQNNRKRCRRVRVTEHSQQGFESFPDDPDLTEFDPADRKFVAVAAACPEVPPILQAADSKWWTWAEALARHGVRVEFLCPEDIKRFHARKGAA
ncbi:hypothetical protein [Candidatus Thiosymbion oneisti]|uniref:hypothetical protein n=1 Tax=Candidatus Thiosymbion oneisti TaxID=589554 RepID=UPI000B7DAD18|nr:hypothetical protein [Candidatus Thiosymbion oneisti]